MLHQNYDLTINTKGGETNKSINHVTYMIEIHKYIAKAKRLWINNWQNNGQKGYDQKDLVITTICQKLIAHY